MSLHVRESWMPQSAVLPPEPGRRYAVNRRAAARPKGRRRAPYCKAEAVGKLVLHNPVLRSPVMQCPVLQRAAASARRPVAVVLQSAVCCA